MTDEHVWLTNMTDLIDMKDDVSDVKYIDGYEQHDRQRNGQAIL